MLAGKSEEKVEIFNLGTGKSLCPGLIEVFERSVGQK